MNLQAGFGLKFGLFRGTSRYLHSYQYNHWHVPYYISMWAGWVKGVGSHDSRYEVMGHLLWLPQGVFVKQIKDMRFTAVLLK